MRPELRTQHQQKGSGLLVLVFILLVSSIALLMLSQGLQQDSRALVQQRQYIELFWAQQTAIEMTQLLKDSCPRPTQTALPNQELTSPQISWQIEQIRARLNCPASSDSQIKIELEHQTADLVPKVIWLNNK